MSLVTLVTNNNFTNISYYGIPRPLQEDGGGVGEWDNFIRPWGVV